MLSTKHLVSNRGHNAHAWQHRFIGFLKFWRLPLNIVYGYSVSVGCMVCSCVFWFGCVSSKSIVSAIGFNLARTNFCFRERLFLYAITGGSGKMDLSVSLFFINFQCFLIICLSLLASSQNCVTKTSFCFLALGICLNKSCCLLLN